MIREKYYNYDFENKYMVEEKFMPKPNNIQISVLDTIRREILCNKSNLIHINVPRRSGKTWSILMMAQRNPHLKIHCIVPVLPQKDELDELANEFGVTNLSSSPENEGFQNISLNDIDILVLSDATEVPTEVYQIFLSSDIKHLSVIRLYTQE